MKKLMIICLILLISFCAQAQDKSKVNVSDKVKTEFAKLYPGAENVRWIKNFNAVNASFLHKGKHIGAIFQADTLFATSKETEIASLPQPVKNHLKKYYDGYSISRAGEIHFVSTPDKNNICYGADITNGTISKRVLCYPNGEEMSVTTLPSERKN